MRVAVVLHALVPHLDDSRRLTESRRRTADQDGHPDLGSVVDALRAGAHRDVYGRAWLLDGLGYHPDVFDVDELTLVGEVTLLPALLDDVQVLLEQLPSTW